MLPSGFLEPKEVLLLARVSRRANQLVAAPASWPRHVVFTKMNLDVAMTRLHGDTFRQKTLALSPLPVEPSVFARLRGLRIVALDCYSSICDMTDGGLAGLRDLPLHNLDLGCCDQITDAGLAHLRELPLTSLNLEWCMEITDAGLASLRNLPLHNLNLRNCEEITDTGLAHLRDLPLTSLNLAGCDKITDAGLASLGDLVAMVQVQTLER